MKILKLFLILFGLLINYCQNRRKKINLQHKNQRYNYMYDKNNNSNRRDQ